MNTPINTSFGIDGNFAAKTFLIVDDFQGMRSMLRDILRGCGAQAKNIDTAANGSEAVAALGKRRYDAVLCDYNLGPGKNGQQVLEEAKINRLIGPACCWVIVTAEKSTETVIGTAEYQPDAYLIKPITEAALRTRLDRLWSKKEAFASIDKAVSGKDFRKAIKLCDERLQTDKANAIDLLRLKCQLLLDAGEFAQAKESFERILAHREVPWAQLGLSRILARSGDLNAAREILEQLVDRNRSYLEAYDLLAEILRALGDKQQAEGILERAVSLSPNSIQRQKSLGDVAFENGRLDGAEKAFRKCVALGEQSVLKSADAMFGLARTCSAKGNKDEALKMIARVGKEFDSEEVRLKSLATEGLIHHQSGDPEAALALAKQLQQQLERKTTPLDSASALDMARLMVAVGEKAQAVAVLEGEVRNHPDDNALIEEVRGLFNAHGLANEGENISARIETLRRESVEMMNRGVLLARDGKFEEAVGWMRDARNRMPSNVRVVFNLVQILIMRMQALGTDPALLREARQALLETHKQAPGEKRFSELMAQLENLSATR